jgi:hypothetical protein
MNGLVRRIIVFYDYPVASVPRRATRDQVQDAPGHKQKKSQSKQYSN